jgi:hypothetical protein
LYKVNDHAEKAARFFVTCQPDPAIKVKVTEAMGEGVLWWRVYQFDAADDCHQVIKLSDTLPAIVLGKERTCSIHGEAEFLMGGGAEAAMPTTSGEE